MASSEGSVSESKTKGLAAEASRSNLYNVNPDNVVIVGLDNDAKPGTPEGARYDERIDLPLYRALVDSIYEVGVLEPVLVCKTEDEFEVVNGRQRIRACREANKRRAKDGLPVWRVPILIKKGDDAYMAAIAMMANELRQDDTPMGRALKVERFITGHGKTDKDAALACGVEPQTIRAWRNLLKLPVKIQKAVEAGKLAPTSAGKLAALGDPEKQLAAFEDLMASGSTSGADVKHKIKKEKANDPGDESTPPQSRTTLRKLVEAQRAGTIELEDSVYQTLRWVLGEVTARKITGLQACLRTLKLEE